MKNYSSSKIWGRNETSGRQNILYDFNQSVDYFQGVLLKSRPAVPFQLCRLPGGRPAQGRGCCPISDLNFSRSQSRGDQLEHPPAGSSGQRGLDGGNEEEFWTSWRPCSKVITFFKYPSRLPFKFYICLVQRWLLISYYKGGQNTGIVQCLIMGTCPEFRLISIQVRWLIYAIVP